MEHDFRRLAAGMEKLIFLQSWNEVNLTMNKFKEIDPDRVKTGPPTGKKSVDAVDEKKMSKHLKLVDWKKNSKLHKPDSMKENSLIKEMDFLDHLSPYLEQAGYYEISQKDVRDLMFTYYRYGDVELKVDLDDFDLLRVWVFGKSGKRDHKTSLREMTEKQWKKFISPDTYEPASGLCHRRVVVAAKSKNAQNMIFKCFKDVPVGHFEVLIPQAKIQLPWKQKWFWNIFLFSSGVAFFCNIGLWLQSEHKLGTFMVWAVVMSFVILRARKVFENVRNRYRILWKQMLYYKSTSNNSALALEVLNRARGQKFKLTLLAYVAALRAANTNQGVTSDQIVGQCNVWFDHIKHAKPDREIGSVNLNVGIAELLNIGILTQTDAEEAYELVGVAAALRKVKEELASLCDEV